MFSELVIYIPGSHWVSNGPETCLRSQNNILWALFSKGPLPFCKSTCSFVQGRSIKQHRSSLPIGQYVFCMRIQALTRILYRSLIPTRVAKVDPGSRGMHRHSPYWCIKLRSKQHGTRAPRIPTISTDTGEPGVCVCVCNVCLLGGFVRSYIKFIL